MNTYLAVEATSAGTLKQVEKEIRQPGPFQVRIKVEATGICHTDSATIEGLWPRGIQFPRVPGHEIAGVIDAVGDRVENWKIGDHVGVGWFGGQCNQCESCRRGDFISCKNLIITGIATDGGYAQSVIAEARALARIPDGMSSIDAAPLLCAGVTTYNALRNAGLRPGDLVAIQGIGGLGHLGLQFANKMGFVTVAIARGKEKEKLARELGAHHYIDSSSEDVAQTLQKMGGSDAILATASSGKSMSALLDGLKARGTLIVLGVSSEPTTFTTLQLIQGSKRIQGAASGTAIDSEDTLKFAFQHQIRSFNEVVPLQEAPLAYAKMMQNQARFRMVLNTQKPG